MNRTPEEILEHCISCDLPTGRAGNDEDSLYCPECSEGPFCEGCFDDHRINEHPCTRCLGMGEVFYQVLRDSKGNIDYLNGSCRNNEMRTEICPRCEGLGYE